MAIALNILLLILGLFFLKKGADWLIDGSIDFGRFLKIPAILIGLTVVAFGTSLPELAVSIFSSLAGNPDIAIGNIIGSNIANIGLILAIAAIIYPLRVKAETVMYEFPFLIVSAFAFVLLANNNYIFKTATFSFFRFDSIIFLVMFIVFLGYIFNSMRKETKAPKEEFKEAYQHQFPLWKDALLIIAGSLLLFTGGRIAVTAGADLARLVGLSEAFIGLTIFALGTSLPELATCVVAAYRRQPDIVVGNIVGSNIFNILFVLGISGSFIEIVVNPILLYVDAMIMIAFTLAFVLIATGNTHIKRVEGVTLLFMYFAYIGYLISGI